MSRFTIMSPLLPEEAASRLQAATGPRRTSMFERSEKPLTGRVTGHAFEVMRTTHGRNSFRPVIRGTIEPDASGTRIRGTMRLHEAVLVVMGLVLVVPGWIFLGGLAGGFNSSALLLPAGLAFLIAMAGSGFAAESRRSRAILIDVFEGKVVD